MFLFEVLLSIWLHACMYSKTWLKWPLSKWPKVGFQGQLSLNAGQKYCILQYLRPSFDIKLLFVIKIFVLFIYGWPLKTGITLNVLGWQLSLELSSLVNEFSSHHAKR